MFPRADKAMAAEQEKQELYDASKLLLNEVAEDDVLAHQVVELARNVLARVDADPDMVDHLGDTDGDIDVLLAEEISIAADGGAVAADHPIIQAQLGSAVEQGPVRRRLIDRVLKLCQVHSVLQLRLFARASVCVCACVYVCAWVYVYACMCVRACV